MSFFILVSLIYHQKNLQEMTMNATETLRKSFATDTKRQYWSSILQKIINRTGLVLSFIIHSSIPVSEMRKKTDLWNYNKKSFERAKVLQNFYKITRKYYVLVLRGKYFLWTIFEKIIQYDNIVTFCVNTPWSLK